jgi:hypothetical protein
MRLMPSPFAFTSAAMSAALEDTPVSYEELAELERDFDDVETEISGSLLSFACCASTQAKFLGYLCT